MYAKDLIDDGEAPAGVIERNEIHSLTGVTQTATTASWPAYEHHASACDAMVRTAMTPRTLTASNYAAETIRRTQRSNQPLGTDVAADHMETMVLPLR